jgi:hypothetical protein
METLNAAQLEILKMFKTFKSEEELKELKAHLSKFLVKKMTDAADKAWEERGYTNETVEQWKHEHFRIKTK